MSLPYEQAIAELNDPFNAGKYSTLDGLMDLVSRLSIDVPGAGPNSVTILYSGALPGDIDGMTPQALAEWIARGADGQVRIIDQTDAARFLNGQDFRTAVRDAVSGLDGPAKDAAIERFFFDAKTGAWAETSARFVDAAQGDIRTITPFARADRIFGQVELERALANPNVKNIDGIPKEYLLKLQADVIAGSSTSDYNWYSCSKRHWKCTGSSSVGMASNPFVSSSNDLGRQR